MMGAPTKTITLGDWLKGAYYVEIFVPTGRPGAKFTARDVLGHIANGPTPEDALQALCEAACGPDTLLDIRRSEKWRAAHEPEPSAGPAEGEGDRTTDAPGICAVCARPFSGVVRKCGCGHTCGMCHECAGVGTLLREHIKALVKVSTIGLAEGEAGVVACRDGALVLVERLKFAEGDKMIADCALGALVRSGAFKAAPCPNTFPTGLPVAYPEAPAGRCDFQDTRDRISAWADERAGDATLLQHNTTQGFFVQLQRGNEVDEAKMYYDLTRLTSADFSRQVDEMLANWERLLNNQKGGE